MPDKPRKQDRRAVLEELRAQQRASRRRGFLLVGVCGLVAVVILGIAGYRILQDRRQQAAFDRLDLSEIGAAASVCQDVTSVSEGMTHDHVDPETQVVYGTAPAAYGEHWSYPDLAPAPFDRKFYTEDDRPELESLVHNLEHGYTILWYDQSVADDGDRLDEVRAIADKFKADGGYNPNLKFIAAPWTAQDEEESGTFPEGSHIAYTHWSAKGDEAGVFQYCSEPSGEALKQFMTDYPYTDSTEAGAP